MKYIEDSLEEADPLVYKLVKLEKKRQKDKLLLNAAISVSPKSVLEIQGSVFDNIDAEGYIPDYFNNETLEDLNDIEKQMSLYKKYRDDRCNKCCEYANIIEALAKKRLARVFSNPNAREEDILVNVQIPTGAIANYIVYDALLKEKDLILSLSLTDGGHTTHGDKVHKTGKKYNFINFHASPEKNSLNYDEIKALLKKHKPKMIVVGTSSFPLDIDWQKIRNLINENSKDTIFMADIAHTAGLVAGGVCNNPVGIADVVTMVTYKTLGGPRASAILTTDKKIGKKIDETIFPNFMGSELLLGVAGIAVTANLAMTAEYKNTQAQIVKNSKALCEELKKLNIPVVYGTSETHIVLVDCSKYGTGKEVANKLEDENILVSACQVHTEKGYKEGIRLGTTFITDQGMTEKDMRKVAIRLVKALEQ